MAFNNPSLIINIDNKNNKDVSGSNYFLLKFKDGDEIKWRSLSTCFYDEKLKELSFYSASKNKRCNFLIKDEELKKFINLAFICLYKKIGIKDKLDILVEEDILNFITDNMVFRSIYNIIKFIGNIIKIIKDIFLNFWPLLILFGILFFFISLIPTCSRKNKEQYREYYRNQMIEQNQKCQCYSRVY